jgi:SAM-dependent methyltransferase
VNLVERVHNAYGGARRMRALCDHVVDMIPPRATLLDVGCGDGLLAERIGILRSDVTVHGVDVLVRPGAKIPVLAYDGLSIPYADDTFDCVLFGDVLHHCDEPLAVLTEARRVARFSVLVKDHTLQGPFSGRLLRFMDDVGNKRYGVSMKYDYWSEARWREVLGELSLEVAEWRATLRLYPMAVDWLFGGALHFLADLRVPGARKPE